MGTYQELGKTYEDAWFVCHPELWPHRPFLPMRKGEEVGAPPGPAFVLESAPTTIIQGSIYVWMRGGSKADFHCVKYASVEEMLADGWTVD